MWVHETSEFCSFHEFVLRNQQDIYKNVIIHQLEISIGNYKL